MMCMYIRCRSELIELNHTYNVYVYNICMLCVAAWIVIVPGQKNA